MVGDRLGLVGKCRVSRESKPPSLCKFTTVFLLMLSQWVEVRSEDGRPIRGHCVTEYIEYTGGPSLHVEVINRRDSPVLIVSAVRVSPQ